MFCGNRYRIVQRFHSKRYETYYDAFIVIRSISNNIYCTYAFISKDVLNFNICITNFINYIQTYTKNLYQTYTRNK